MSVKISVILGTYREPLEWIKDSIESVLNQTFSDFEIILLNDNPESEELRQFLYRYSLKDKRIKLINNPENIGIIGTFNKGIELSKGKYIARMDADDIALPNRFEIQYNFMENNPEVGVCGSFAETFGNKKRILTVPITDRDIRDNIIDRCPFIHPTVFMRSALFNFSQIRYKDENAEDYGLWIDLQGVTSFYNLNAILLKYRISNRQVSYKNPRQKIAAQKVKKRAIQLIFGEKVSEELFNQEMITVKKIKKIKLLIPEQITENARRKFIENLYLSQSKYTLHAAISYLLQEKKPQFTIFLKLIKRIIKHQTINSRIDVSTD